VLTVDTNDVQMYGYVQYMKKKIFLSGPMRGVQRSLGLKWRVDAASYLSEKFDTLHALRGREQKESFTDSRAAVARDLADIKNCDILLVNDSFENCSMIGTSMEVFFAYQLHKPVIIFGNAHGEDYWLNYHSHLRVKDLKEACDVLNRMFS